jgi:sugar phosphate isomerase/epimerase
MISRRDLLIQSISLAAAFPAARLATAYPASGSGRAIGIRCAPVRPDDAAETLHSLEAMGYKEVEGVYREIDAAWPAFRSSSLRKLGVADTNGRLLSPSGGDELSRFLEQVKTWGFAYVSCSYKAPDEGTGLEKYRIFSDWMNRAGEKCRATGLNLLYHNQVFEFEPIEGSTGYEILTSRLDKSLCSLEMDVYWMSLAGHDPAELLLKFSGRVMSIHMKDKPAGVPIMYKHIPGPGSATFLNVGSGSLDWPAILRAAVSAGVSHYIVEPDGASGSEVVANARKSIEYLSKLQF